MLICTCRTPRSRMRAAARSLSRMPFVLSLTSKPSTAGVGQQVEEVFSQEQLAAAEDQEERAGCGELIEHRLDLARRHLAVIVVIEVAVDAPLVAPVGEIEVHGQRNAVRERPIPDPLHEVAHHTIPSARPSAPSSASTMASAEVRRMPWLDSSLTNSSTSRAALSPSTSNSRQITSATIACSGRSAVGRFPDGGADGVEHVEARVVGAEDHHLAADFSGREARRPSR